jgi:hypothetical protein
MVPAAGISFMPGTNDHAAILLANTKAKKKLPMIMIIIPFAISPDVGFTVLSNLISFAQALPNNGVYHKKPRIKLATTAMSTAIQLIVISSIALRFVEVDLTKGLLIKTIIHHPHWVILKIKDIKAK